MEREAADGAWPPFIVRAFEHWREAAGGPLYEDEAR